jgi:hypothetical protein
MALIAIEVAKATKAGRYGDGQGLYLQVTHSGAKSWLPRYERWLRAVDGFGTAAHS